MPDEGLKNNPQNTERLNIKPFSTDFVKAQIEQLLGSVELIKTVRSVEVAINPHNQMRLDLAITAKGFDIGVTATLENDGNTLTVKEHKVTVNFLARGFAEGAIKPHLDNVGKLLKDYIEKTEKQKVLKIEIKNGQLEVTFEKKAEVETSTPKKEVPPERKDSSQTNTPENAVPAETIRADAYFVNPNTDGSFRDDREQKRFEKGSSLFKMQKDGAFALVEYVNNEANLKDAIYMPETMLVPIYSLENEPAQLKDGVRDGLDPAAIKTFITIRHPKFEKTAEGWKLLEKGLGAYSTSEYKIDPPVKNKEKTNTTLVEGKKTLPEQMKSIRSMLEKLLIKSSEFSIRSKIAKMGSVPYLTGGFGASDTFEYILDLLERAAKEGNQEKIGVLNQLEKALAEILKELENKETEKSANAGGGKENQSEKKSYKSTLTHKKGRGYFRVDGKEETLVYFESPKTLIINEYEFTTNTNTNNVVGDGSGKTGYILFHDGSRFDGKTGELELAHDDGSTEITIRKLSKEELDELKQKQQKFQDKMGERAEKASDKKEGFSRINLKREETWYTVEHNISGYEINAPQNSFVVTFKNVAEVNLKTRKITKLAGWKEGFEINFPEVEDKKNNKKVEKKEPVIIETPEAPQIETHTVKDFEQAVATYLYENSKNFKTLINFKYKPEGADVSVEVFYKNKKGTRTSVEMSAAEVFEQSLGRKVSQVVMLGNNFLVTFKEDTTETTEPAAEVSQSAKEKEVEVIVNEEIPEPEEGITGSGRGQMRPSEFEDFVANGEEIEKKKSLKEIELEKLIARKEEIAKEKERIAELRAALLKKLEEIEKNKK